MFSRRGKSEKYEISTKRPSASGASRKDNKSSLFSRSKALFRTSVTPRDQGEDVKGPLGLNLLHSPKDPEVDFIFVHGLGGGSRKTWSKSRLGTDFWPKDWLANDPAFQHVRIHSYGYDSDCMKSRQDCLNIHRIGTSLLGAIGTSPSIADSATYIVAIGHSLGGLVIKKALTLASQDPYYRPLADRFSDLYFLGTPHRGANSTKMLKNLMKVAYDKGYVGDMDSNSQAIQVINDEFHHLAAEVDLWSFYETQNTKSLSSLVVEPEFAVLGYREERQIPIATDHQSICKFDTPEDSNYVLLRNALASAAKKKSSQKSEAKSKDARKIKELLRKFLGVSHGIDDDFVRVREARIEGTCGWISKKPQFVRWMDGSDLGAKVLWIKAHPGSGKSVLAGYIIGELQAMDEPCSFFFIEHGDESKSKIGSCLRSLAFQMVCSNSDVANRVLEIKENYDCLDGFDDQTLWRILFSSGIFQVIKDRHYWVIDALDECSGFLNFLKGMLSKIDESIPMRILITSRYTSDLNYGFSEISPRVLRDFVISTADTKSDINILIQKRVGVIEVMSRAHRGEVGEKILDKSEGSFIWAISVLDELFHCTTRKECDKVLAEVPKGIDSLYKRALIKLSQAPHGKELAKVIFMWAACAVRPLTIIELGNALTLGINDSFPNLENAIFMICGQLVVVDTANRVKMIHETAREFLLHRQSRSEFSIDQAKAHTQMANVCLKYLTGMEMKPPRTNQSRVPSSSDVAVDGQDFSTYAYTAYSYHLSKADPKSTETFKLTMRFLKSNVFTWIERLATSGNLYHLVTASRRLQTYANSYATVCSLKDPRLADLRQWASDFARIPAMFTPALTVSPRGIHTVIPAFCPTRSMIHNNGNSRPWIEVIGASNEQWNSRVMSINFPQGPPRTIRYGEHFLAVGFMSGTVTLYRKRSYQEYSTLDHGEMVQFISFQPNSDLLATCGMKETKVWDVKTRQVIRSVSSPPRPLGLEWDCNKLLIASSDNYIATWDLNRDKLIESMQMEWRSTDKEEGSQKPSLGTPSVLAMSTAHSLLAATYSRQAIILWDLQKGTHIGTRGKKTTNGEISTQPITTLVFSPNPDIRLLAALYKDGDVVILDPMRDRQVAQMRINCQNIASSPDGRRLAASSANGIIQIYEFTSLKLMYQVKAFDSLIKDLAFSTDGINIADIRATQCTVWAPPALMDESTSVGTASSAFNPVLEEVTLSSDVIINAIAVHHSADVIFVGKADGSIELYDRKTADSLGSIHTHKATIHLLTWIAQRNCLLSVDASSRIILHRIRRSEKGWLSSLEIPFNYRLDILSAIVDVLVDERNGKLIVSTNESDHLFDLDSQECEKEEKYELTQKTRKWIPHPTLSSRLIRVEGDKLCVYTWGDLSECLSVSLPLTHDTAELKGANIYRLDGRASIIVELSSLNGSKMAIIDESWLHMEEDQHNQGSSERAPSRASVNMFVANKDTGVTVVQYPTGTPTSSHIVELELDATHVLGTYDSKLVFLTKSSWVCSVDLRQSSLSPTEYTDSQSIEVNEHFFIPHDWFTGKSLGEAPCLIARDDIILTRGGGLAVIRGGLRHTERVVQKSR